MIRIALIGGTGTGKSTVARYLQDNYQALWLDCDALGHQLLKDREIMEKIFKRFGQALIEDKTSGQISRKKLGSIVFRDRQALADLNAILHPPLMERLSQDQERARKAGYQLCVLDGAVLMDVNVKAMVDQVWAISAGRDLRIERLVKERGMDRARVEEIMQNQISPDQYAAYAHVTIATDLGPAVFSRLVDDLVLSYGLKPLPTQLAKGDPTEESNNIRN